MKETSNMYKYLWIFLVLIFSCDGDIPSLRINSSQNQLFSAIPASHSGVTFNNQLTENLSTGENILDFDLFFNGSGVAIADFDNDGLEDIFFAGNQVDNRIYKNQGEFQFTDKTKTSGINTKDKGWSNGVSCADINQDGFIDIYVSQGGPYGPEKRPNLLFINNGDFTFSEQADKFGLNDNGISSQAAFFDYDKDGDLDCFVMNESPLLGFDPARFYSMINRHSSSMLHVSCSHLYRNDNGHFVDVSYEAGVLIPSFGLGLCISDINNDNWLDIYVANDYYIPDAVYINNQKGGFIDETKSVMKQSSFYSMGVDIADLNNDGHQDLYVLDMASVDHVKSKTLMASMNVQNFELLTKTFKFPYQYMFNSLQLNDGNNKFNNIAHYSGTAKTDWSWACLIEDFDLDGQKEIFVSNGYRKYARDNDFQNRVLELKAKYKEEEIPLAEKEAIYKTVPSEKLANVFFDQTEPMQFEDKAKNVGLDAVSFSNGAAYADLDNDGDLDLVISNIDEAAFIYKNNSQEKGQNYLKVKLKSRTSEPFAKVNIYYQGKTQVSEAKRVRGYLSSQPNDIVFGLGEVNTIDSLVVTWTNEKSQKLSKPKTNQTIVLNESKATAKSTNTTKLDDRFTASKSILPNFKHIENEYNDFQTETLVPYKQSLTGPRIKTMAPNKIFVSGSSKMPAAIYNHSGTKLSEFDTGQSEIVDALFFDLEGDGDQDAYLIAGGNGQPKKSATYNDQLWINDNGKYTKSNQTNLYAGASGKTGLVIDYDKDGDQDLIVCNRITPQQYPLHAPSMILNNDNGKLKDITSVVAPDLSKFGIINDIEMLDFNADGWMDFLVVGEWTGIGLFQNNKGKFENVSNQYGLDNKLGWWFSISPTDINQDGKQDYILGNLGLNSKYKASEKKPLVIYGHDFDENGSFDQVLSYTYKGEEVPFRGRQCSSEQMPFIAEKFKSFDAFANATLKEVYGDGLSEATRKTANTFSSIVLIHTDNSFEIQALPLEAQFNPIMDGVSIDIDNNGFEDVILIGNLYETEVETPRLDFSNATVLLSDGESYSYSQELSKQIKINGNSKSIELFVEKNGKSKILIGVNNDQVREYTLAK